MGDRQQSPTTRAPEWVGRYEIVRPIARGGMAEVFLARARPVAGVERLFAIKVCHPHLRDDHEFASMFIEEARLAAQIRHPNVVATFDVGDDEMLYLVMEYVEGEPLSELIKAARQENKKEKNEEKNQDKNQEQNQQHGDPGLSLPVTLRILTDALAGLHAAHETRDQNGRPLGVVHRDVSPQNILVGVDGVARIVDFGIAKAEATATVTREGQVKGKLAYLPPEQLTEHVMTRRGDVYAVGVVLWETLTCQRLFSGQTAGEIAIRVLEKVVEPPSTVVPGIPPSLDAAVLKALARDPEQRFATAADLASALEGCGVSLASHRTVGQLVAAVHATRAAQTPASNRGTPLPAQAAAESAATTARTAIEALRKRAVGAADGPAQDPGQGQKQGPGRAHEQGRVPPSQGGLRWRLLAGAAVTLTLVAGAGLIIAARHVGSAPASRSPAMISPPPPTPAAPAGENQVPAIAAPTAPLPEPDPRVRAAAAPRKLAVATKATVAAARRRRNGRSPRSAAAAAAAAQRAPTPAGTASPARPPQAPASAPSEYRPGGV